jgi:hypothetical protein
MGDESKASESGLSKKPGTLSEFDTFSKVIVSTIKEVAEVANNGVSNFLLGLGTAILVLGIFLRLRPLGVQVSDLTPTEFIALIVLCGVLILFGAYLRLYQYQKDGEVSRALTEAGTRLLEKTVEAATEFTQKPAQPRPPI